MNGNKLTASFPENAEAMNLTVTYVADTVAYKVKTRTEKPDGETFEETETTAEGKVGELTEITAEEKPVLLQNRSLSRKSKQTAPQSLLLSMYATPTL